jgi:hypothetical protein
MPYDKNFIDKIGAHLNALQGMDDGGKKPKSAPESTIIPRPAPGDEKSIQNYRNQLHKKYGEALSGREDIPEYLSQTYEQETTPVKDIVTKSAEKSGLRPELFYASAMEEGMRGLFPTAKNKGQIDYSGDPKYPVSGFVNFGLDTFGQKFPELVKGGYLPKDFEKNFKKSPEVNDKKEKVVSANFADLPSAVAAKAAMVKLSQDEITKFAEQKKIALSPKAKEFFTLVHYNAGVGNAKKMLEEYNKAGYLKDDKFLEKQPSKYWTGPYTHVIKRINAANAIKSEQYF